MMLEKQALELILGNLGATSNSIFVLYDNNGNVDAARLWWILTTYGHSNTYLLNGGLKSTPKGLISQEITSTKPTKFLFSNEADFDLKANKKDVLTALTDSNTVLLDCRTSDEFTGKITKKNAFRAGHIPTAIHLNYTHSIAYDQAYQFKSDQELALIFKTIPKDKKIIVYCQSGVRSAHTTFVLHKLLGFPNVANYDGSWIEWSYDKTLAIEAGF
jgi:thiosulfate/3-mercaptopyruvate sulfurtransferase